MPEKYESVEDMLDDLLVVYWLNPPVDRTPENYKKKIAELVSEEVKLHLYFNNNVTFEDGEGI